MQCEELSAREEFTYSHMSTLERGSGTLGRRSDRGSERRSNRGERDSYTVDVRASDLQLSQPEPLKHPCFSYRAWLYSVLIGVRGKTVRTGPFTVGVHRNYIKELGYCSGFCGVRDHSPLMLATVNVDLSFQTIILIHLDTFIKIHNLVLHLYLSDEKTYFYNNLMK